MKAIEVPRVLFREFSERLGIGEEVEVEIAGCAEDTWRFRELRDNLGAIGFQESGDRSYFAVWPYLPEPKKANYSGHLMKIEAGPHNTGTWGYGSGHEMRETATAWFHSFGLRLHHSAIVTVAQVLSRATELIQSAECEKTVFWQAERHPEGNYTKP